MMSRSKHDTEEQFETNEQFILRLMRFSRHGALMQLFILDSLHKWSATIVKSGIRDVRKQMKDGLVSPDAWFSVAKELQEELNKR
jgi:hypothetical protein